MFPPGVRYRSVTIRPPFRPDCYEFWPVFSDCELLARARRLPFHLATLLIERNLRRLSELGYQSELKSWLHASATEQQAMLGEVMAFVGLPSHVHEAIASVPRVLFVREDLRHLAGINESLPYSRGSWTTMPGLVGLMLAHTPRNLAAYVEVGAGSGYHLACLSRIAPRASITGYEVNRAYAEFGQEALRRLGGHTPTIHNRSFTPGDLRGLSHTCVFFTNAPGGYLHEFLDALPETCVLQVPRLLTPEEMSCAPEFLAQTYGSYERYVEVGDFSCLTHFEKHEGTLKQDNLVYDVQFVAYREEDYTPADAQTPMPSPFKWAILDRDE
jgi:Protein-L-isoaspartate(D-aspartate) O-methyltransferase (PCMT)